MAHLASRRGQLFRRAHHCTAFLKRDRIDADARYRLGLWHWHSAVGLRAGEPRRVRRMRAMACGARTGARAVLPRADWWIEQEAKVADRTGPEGRYSASLKRFRFAETYAELKAAALAWRDLFDEDRPDDAAGTADCICTD